MTRYRRAALAAFFFLPFTGAAGLKGQSPDFSGGGGPSAAAQSGTIVGVVTDAANGRPLAGVQVRLSELGRGELSHADGSFHFERLAPATYTLSAQRVGYAPAHRRVRVAAGDTARVELALAPSAITLEAVVVTGTGRERASGETYRPTSVMGGAELRRELGSSVAATLEREPGISQRYNGPAAAQPVIRGLSGDRVLVLEDGERTGDIASTSSDHAVTIDPVTAERIEVVRGPAALLYGSSALGGVVNVVREEVPRSLPERLAGTVSAHLESVNDGLTGAASAIAPVGSFAVRSEVSGRMAGDTRTPLGRLPSTEMEQQGGGAGASWIHHRGFAGVAVRHLGMEYGVPGEFNGQVIPGAHEGGASISLHRTAFRAQAEQLLRIGPVRAVELDAGYVRFRQEEREPEGAVGSRFGQITGTGSLVVRHQHDAGGLLTEGAVGIRGSARDFRAAGGSTGTVPAREHSLAAFIFEELSLGRLGLQAGARYDWTRVVPEETGSTPIGEVRTREFGAFSGSVGALYELREGWSVGGSVARAFRTPTIEELFSNGPHLADFSYNVGNPDLASEHGLGMDVFVRGALARLRMEVSAFRNAIDNYVYYAPTGRLDPRFGRFPVYQAQGDDAVLTGGEARVQWEGVRYLVVDGSASYVRGTRRGDGEPLPAIPPLQGRVGLRYDRPAYFAGVEWEGAARQDRVADDGAGGRETPTPGYSLWGMHAGVRWTLRGRLHTLTLNVRNLIDAEWRQHLSRIKDIAPQPGRNVQLLYRLSF